MRDGWDDDDAALSGGIRDGTGGGQALLKRPTRKLWGNVAKAPHAKAVGKSAQAEREKGSRGGLRPFSFSLAVSRGSASGGVQGQSPAVPP